MQQDWAVDLSLHKNNDQEEPQDQRTDPALQKRFPGRATLEDFDVAGDEGDGGGGDAGDAQRLAQSCACISSVSNGQRPLAKGAIGIRTLISWRLSTDLPRRRV